MNTLNIIDYWDMFTDNEKIKNWIQIVEYFKYDKEYQIEDINKNEYFDFLIGSNILILENNKVYLNRKLDQNKIKKIKNCYNQTFTKAFTFRDIIIEPRGLRLNSDEKNIIKINMKNIYSDYSINMFYEESLFNGNKPVDYYLILDSRLPEFKNEVIEPNGDFWDLVDINKEYIKLY